MKNSKFIIDNSNVVYSILNEKKFNKLICTLDVKSDHQNVVHNCEPNIIKAICYEKNNNECGKIFFRGNTSKDVIKINYLINNIILDTVYLPLSSECDVWYQYAFGNFFKIEIYE